MGYYVLHNFYVMFITKFKLIYFCTRMTEALDLKQLLDIDNNKASSHAVAIKEGVASIL